MKTQNIYFYLKAFASLVIGIGGILGIYGSGLYEKGMLTTLGLVSLTIGLLGLSISFIIIIYEHQLESENIAAQGVILNKIIQTLYKIDTVDIEYLFSFSSNDPFYQGLNQKITNIAKKFANGQELPNSKTLHVLKGIERVTRVQFSHHDFDQILLSSFFPTLAIAIVNDLNFNKLKSKNSNLVSWYDIKDDSEIIYHSITLDHRETQYNFFYLNEETYMAGNSISNLPIFHETGNVLSQQDLNGKYLVIFISGPFADKLNLERFRVWFNRSGSKNYPFSVSIDKDFNPPETLSSQGWKLFAVQIEVK